MGANPQGPRSAYAESWGFRCGRHGLNFGCRGQILAFSHLLAPFAVVFKIQKYVRIPLSTGSIGICVLNTSGTISCWDTRGQTNSPEVQYSSVHASVYGDFACGLRTDRIIHCWGSNQFGQTDAPAGQFSELVTGKHHACGIRTDGSLLCWGAPDQMELPIDKLRFLSSSGYTICGIGVKGFVHCWGDSIFKEMELRNMQVRKVSVGNFHLCGITANSRIQCIGGNWSGQTNVPDAVFCDLSVTDSQT